MIKPINEFNKNNETTQSMNTEPAPFDFGYVGSNNVTREIVLNTINGIKKINPKLKVIQLVGIAFNLYDQR